LVGDRQQLLGARVGDLLQTLLEFGHPAALPANVDFGGLLGVQIRSSTKSSPI
jgi:hypothetical protein